MRPNETLVSMEQLAPLIEQIVAAGGDVTIQVTGNSMNPLWRHRKNNVVLTGCDPAALKRGDVPLYRRDGGQFVLHRIFRLRDGCFDMAGDAQTEIEAGIRPDQVVALLKGYYTEQGAYRSCRSVRYRLYKTLWRLGYPLRRYLLVLWRRTLLKRRIRKGGPTDEI